ncbi:MAG: thioesterase family protein [Candidatus Rokubacteria bacterium]|nr:thioesterase family protein [Candidatus Rokubacteria bacterium]
MTASGRVETYRGVVYRWELDHNDHFTVAYYFQRFGDAGRAVLETLGFEPARFATADVYVRYLRELRAGDLMHVTSGIIGVDGEGFTAGHTLFSSESDDVAATVEHRLVRLDDGGKPAALDRAERASLEARRVAWDAPARERRPRPASLDGFADAARDTIRPSEIDASGRVALSAYIHRFSAANGHATARFGITPAYQRDARRGFSTFEFQLALGSHDVRAGDLVRVRSALVHVGSSSMRLLHRMTNDRTDEEIATLEQAGVHLDMDARRSTPLPDDIRTRALAVLVRA